MASYTIELRRVCDLYGRDTVESWFKSYNIEDYLLPSQIEAISKSGLFNKEKLARKIVDHYFMREIGFETPALFEHYAKVEMQEIMEYYLPLIYSTAIEFDPLVNVDYTETFEREIEGNAQNQGTSNSSSNNTSSGLNVNSDTPQGQISKNDILQGNYASNTTANENEAQINDRTNTESSGTSNTLENYSKRIKGNSGVSATAQALIKQYRDIVKAYDKEIIEKLNTLFMGIY